MNKREKNKKKIAIFDLDGTLADTRKDLATGINLMRKHYGFEPLPQEVVAGYVGDGIRKLVERALSDVRNPPPIDEAVKMNAQFYREHIVDETTLYPGVSEGLETLCQNNFFNTVITNKPYKAAVFILEHFKIKKFFKMIIGGDSGFPLKPDPSAIFHVISEINKKYNFALNANEHGWVIGDNHTDIAAAKNASLKSIFVNYGFGKLLEQSPCVVCNSFTEVVEVLISEQ
jgi:phosphoglycolate phosphatase